MGEKTIDALVEGGKASTGPPIGPAVGPLGLKIKDVVKEINEQTMDYEGMTVPIKLVVDDDTKEYRIEVGSPPTSALIKKELGIEKGARGGLEREIVGDLSFSQVVEIAQKKKGNSFAYDQKSRTKEVLGTCLSMGVTVDGKDPKDLQTEIEEGLYDSWFG